RSSDSALESAGAEPPRAGESIRVHHHREQQSALRGGSLHESGQSQLGDVDQHHSHRQLLAVQRSEVDELSQPLLPLSRAVTALESWPRCRYPSAMSKVEQIKASIEALTLEE